MPFMIESTAPAPPSKRAAPSPEAAARAFSTTL
jgi:hypothetical protein